MFNSPKGFYLIERNQEWVFIGAGPYDDRSIVLTGSAIDEDQSEVYFSYENGTVWAFNYETRQWYKWELTSTIRGIALHDSNLVGSSDFGYWKYLTTSTADSREGQSNRVVAQEYVTGWIRFGNIRGYQRVKRAYLIGEVLANCTVTVEVMVDYSNTVVQTYTIDSSLITANPMQLDLHLAVQKCESMSFRITTSNHGIKFSGATLEIGVKQDLDKSRSSSTNFRG